jgi:ABC-type polar amino acid transport system ATPase subunit
MRWSPSRRATSWSTASACPTQDQPAQAAQPRGHGVPALRAVPHLSVTENLTIAQIKVLGRNKDDARSAA